MAESKEVQALKMALETLQWIAADAAPGYNYLADAARNVIPTIEEALRG